MNPTLPRRIRLAAAALALTLLLAGCGSRGALYLPDPAADKIKTESGSRK